jgi:hypothetical protein
MGVIFQQRPEKLSPCAGPAVAPKRLRDAGRSTKRFGRRGKRSRVFQRSSPGNVRFANGFYLELAQPERSSRIAGVVAPGPHGSMEDVQRRQSLWALPRAEEHTAILLEAVAVIVVEPGESAVGKLAAHRDARPAGTQLLLPANLRVVAEGFPESRRRVVAKLVQLGAGREARPVRRG